MIVRNKFSERYQVLAKHADDSRTQEHLAADCDINNIIAKYNRTGQIDHIKRAEARYGSFEDLAEFGVNMDKVAKAKQAFEQIPSALRERFGNSMDKFYASINDPKLDDEFVRLGIKKRPKADPAPHEPAPQATKKGAIKKTPVVPTTPEPTED